MKTRLSTLALILLAFLNVFTFFYTTQALGKTGNIEAKLENNPPKIVYVQAKDGYTPIFGKDYKDGAPGINAVSYTITRETINEVPLVGSKGDEGESPECLLETNQCRGESGKDGRDGLNGQDGQTQQLRVNPDTKDIESKYTDTKYWDILVPCTEYKMECP